MNRLVWKFGKRVLATFAAIGTLTLGAAAVRAQTYNSAAGGYNGGYGQVYQSFGLAQATLNMQQLANMQMQQAMMRQAMKTQQNRRAAAPVTNAARSNAPSRPAPTVNYAAFTPVPRADNYRTIAETLGETPEEKQYLARLFAETKRAFETEAAKVGGKNNLAAAMVFFTVASVTVYHDAPEPSDAATENLFRALDGVFNETAGIEEVPNADKQKLYDSLVCFSGLVLAGYTEGKQTGDKEMTAQYRQIAGSLIEMILKIKPDKIRFKGDELQIDR